MKRNRVPAWLKDWRILTVCSGCIFTGFLIGMLIFGSPWHLPPAWGDIPTRITGLATIGLVLGAIITARYTINAFRKQSEDVHDQAEMLRIQPEQLAEQAPLMSERPGRDWRVPGQ